MTTSRRGDEDFERVVRIIHHANRAWKRAGEGDTGTEFESAEASGRMRSRFYRHVKRYAQARLLLDFGHAVSLEVDRDAAHPALVLDRAVVIRGDDGYDVSVRDACHTTVDLVRACASGKVR